MTAAGPTDCHVHILPPWARREQIDLSTESGALKQALAHPRATALRQASEVGAVVREMDRHGIARAICFSYQWNDPRKCADANDYTLDCLDRFDDRLLGLAVVQPRDAQSVPELRRMLKHPRVVGLKVKPKWGGFSLADIDLLRPLCELLLQERGFLLTHISQNFHPSAGDSVSDLLALTSEFPRLVVVAAHLGGFVDTYQLFEPTRSKMENLFIDISLPRNLEWLPSLMRLGNPHRYLWATDYPFMGFGELRTRLANLGLTDEELDLLERQNPDRLLSGLPPLTP